MALKYTYYIYLCIKDFIYTIMEILKKYLLDVVAVIAFAVVAYAYFMPATLDGRILYRPLIPAPACFLQPLRPIICGCPIMFGMYLPTS